MTAGNNILSALLTLICFPVAIYAATYEVGQKNGMPQLLCNGIPTAPAMVYVNKDAQEIAKIGPLRRVATFRFGVHDNWEDGALHLRFFSLAHRKTPENIILHRIEVRDETSGQIVKRYDFHGEKVDPAIQYWCRGKRRNPPIRLENRSGALHIAVSGDPDGKLEEFHMILREIPVRKGKFYRIECDIYADREQFVSSSLYRQLSPPQGLTLPGTALVSQVRLAKESGVDFVTFPAGDVWFDENGNPPDYYQLEQLCRAILKINPNARLIPRINLCIPPLWWQKKYSGELMHFTNSPNNGYPSPSSRQYRKDAVTALRGAIRFCEKNFKKNMAGYHPTGGNTNEWFYYRSQWKHLGGYDDATQKAFRNFLAAKYGSDTHLRKAWNQKKPTLANAEIPSPEAREAVRRNGLLSPKTEQAMIDFHFFLQKEMADTVLALARTIREETGRNRLSIFFYGYIFELAGNPNGPASSGHNNLRRILNSPDIDILAAPISYQDRQLGGGTSAMAPAESVRLAGKLWLNEDDTTTDAAWKINNLAPGGKQAAKTLPETLAMLKRNTTVAAFRGFGIWYMDLGGTGWFAVPEYWKEMQNFIKLRRYFEDTDEQPETAIAEIVDEASLCFATPVSHPYNRELIGPMVRNDRAVRNRLGCTVGQYLMDDIIAGRVRSRLNIFTSAFALNGEQRKKLRDLAGSIPAFWFWAPGYLNLDNGEYSLAAVEETTGFSVRKKTKISPAIKVTETGKQLGLSGKNWPEKTENIDPLLAVETQPGDLVLATYRDGSAAVVVRPGKTPALFCGVPVIHAELYRWFIRYLNLPCYSSRPAYIWKRGSLLGVCAPEKGRYRLQFGVSGIVHEYPSGSPVGIGPNIELELDKGEIRIFQFPSETRKK